MELTCLNCTGTFEADGATIASAGGVLRCPLCGREQRFDARGDRPVPAVEPVEAAGRREPASEGFGAAFRKPMQAFGTGRRVTRPPASAAREIVTPEPLRVTTAETPPVEAGAPPPADVVPPRRPTGPVSESRAVPPIPDRTVETKAVANPGEQASGLWTVKSPTGLVMEFPSSNLLVNWSAVVENPAPYLVSRGGDEWMSLEEFVRETKRGIRATQAFRNSPESRTLVPVQGAPEAAAGVAPGAPAAAGQGPAGVPSADAARGPDSQPPSQRNAVSTTAQFTFKIANSSKPGMPQWAKALIVLGVLTLLGGGAAAVFLFMK